MMVERAAKTLLGVAVFLIIAAVMCGCSLHDVQYPFGDPAAAQSASNGGEVVINLNGGGAAADSHPAPQPLAAVSPAAAKTAVPGLPAVPEMPRETVKGDPIEVPAPELENVNRYARALETKLLQRYNNTPAYAGRVGKVQLLPVGEPQPSLDGRKMRMEWSQVVFDEWGKRIPELEKEFYVVTFGDGKPLMQRTRPSITVGLNNEGGYSEYNPVRGGALSGQGTVGNPAMFDRPSSARTGILDDNLESRNSRPLAADFLDLPAVGAAAAESADIKSLAVPIVQPVGENLSAVVVAE